MPFCEQCGASVKGKFCRKCGAAVDSDSDSGDSLDLSDNGGGSVAAAVARAIQNGEKVPKTIKVKKERSKKKTFADLVMIAMENPNEFNKDDHVSVCDTTQSEPCHLCQERGIDGADSSLKQRIWFLTGNMVCDECLKPVGVGELHYYCDRVIEIRSGKHNTRTYCHRTVCLSCYGHSRHQKAHSRWNHNEPTWKASLLCCDGLFAITACTWMCHWNPVFSITPPLLDDRHETQESYHTFDYIGASIAFTAVGLANYPLFILAELFGVSAWYQHKSQKDLRVNFGLEPMPCPLIYFCRPCAMGKMRREWELRGYRQPTPCGCGPSREERLAAWPPPPAGVPARLQTPAWGPTEPAAPPTSSAAVLVAPPQTQQMALY